MKQFTDESLSKLWKAGYTLEQSKIEFGDKSITESFRNAKSEFDSWNESSIEEKAESIDFAYELTEGLKYKELLSNFESSNEEVKISILNMILNESVVGIGYQSPISISNSIQLIPIHIWPISIAKIDWEESSFSNNGIELLNIRLINYPVFEELNDDQLNQNKIIPPEIPVREKKVGRPSKQDRVIEAFEFLEKAQKIDYSKNFKSHTEIIRQTVKQLNPDITSGEGLSDEVIRIAATPLFKNNKPT